MNKVILFGRIGAAPREHQNKNGVPFVSFNLRTSEHWVDSDGNKQQRVTWHRCVAYSTIGQMLLHYGVHEGDDVLIEGKINNFKLDDNGQTKHYSEIIIEQFRLASKPSRGGRENHRVPRTPTGDAQ